MYMTWNKSSESEDSESIDVITSLSIKTHKKCRGAFSVVHLAVDKKTGDRVAVKIIDKTQANAEADEKRLKNEVRFLGL